MDQASSALREAAEARSSCSKRTSGREDPTAWTRFVTLLVALDAEHRNHFHVLMQGCRPLQETRRVLAPNGFWNRLTSRIARV